MRYESKSSCDTPLIFVYWYGPTFTATFSDRIWCIFRLNEGNQLKVSFYDALLRVQTETNLES